MMFRREMRREERRDVVEVAAVGGMVHETRKEHAEEAELAELQAQPAQQAGEQAQAAAAPEAAAPAAAAAPAPAAAPSAVDLTDEQVSELERLAKLKEEGILTDAEFSAEKARILGL
jgi:hypothetical protein